MSDDTAGGRIMTKVKTKMMLLPHAVDLPLPTEHATGLDLVATIPFDWAVTIAPGERAAIPTGIVTASSRRRRRRPGHRRSGERHDDRRLPARP
jgi:dUTPase